MGKSVPQQIQLQSSDGSLKARESILPSSGNQVPISITNEKKHQKNVSKIEPFKATLAAYMKRQQPKDILACAGINQQCLDQDKTVAVTEKESIRDDCITQDNNYLNDFSDERTSHNDKQIQLTNY